MAVSRQGAFQQLRGPCVELSSVALKFRGKQASVKQVVHALEAVQKILSALGNKNALDEKLAEYAFFPLTHIFNESQRLSSSCLQSAVQCVIILASKGWRSRLLPDMGRQLLILMTLIGAPDPKTQTEPPSEELKIVSIQCIGTVVEQLAGRSDSKQLFDDVSTKNIVDQLAYMLLESITQCESDQVQIAAANALLILISNISSRVLLASLLPRTASSLTQVLKSSTRARRTRTVLVSYLNLLTLILRLVLADDVVYPLAQDPGENESNHAAIAALDASWLRATASQVQLVLVQVTKLRTHDGQEVRQSVADLCLMVTEECQKSLSESTSVAVETLLFVLQYADSSSLQSRIEHLAASNANIAGIIQAKFYEWCQSLPRIMQGNDDAPKLRVLDQLGSSITTMHNVSQLSAEGIGQLTTTLLNSLATATSTGTPGSSLLQEQAKGPVTRLNLEAANDSTFKQVVLGNVNEKDVSSRLQHLLLTCESNGISSQMARFLIDRIGGGSHLVRVHASWLALTCLRIQENTSGGLSTMIDLEDSQSGVELSQAQLVSELYTAALPSLLDSDAFHEAEEWRLKALAIECTVLQAQQLGAAYRLELMDTLYPILSLLASRSQVLREHAMTGLNLLAKACQYSSASDMLIDNVDYLINSVALKLNSFDVSPQAPQVILMMLRLCGARIVPYLDDLIGSIFSALDNFHGYPQLVELLVQVLKTVVDESKAKSGMVLTNGMSDPAHEMRPCNLSQISDIVDDLQKRNSRKRKDKRSLEKRHAAPGQPWASDSEPTESHGVNALPSGSSDESDTSAFSPKDSDKKVKLSKPHQLLLDIAKSTSPHLSSPSPQVRHLLLQLIEEVAPLLARDENSFLPLINAVWPFIIGRLLSFSDSLEEADMAYNIVAAANAIVALCKGAGNFLSSRISEIFPKLSKLFSQVRSNGKETGTTADSTAFAPKHSDLTVSAVRTSQSLIFAALIKLLATIIQYVRVSEDIGDEIMVMLVPFTMRQDSGEVKTALSNYNSDALWLLEQTSAHRNHITNRLVIEMLP